MSIRRNLQILLIAAVLPAFSASQVGIESASNSMYPAQWPAGPSPNSVPEWAKPGRIRFSRWDGGRIETAKAVLSGWPGFNPPDPNRLETMTNWYQPETVRFLREAEINMVWVTFSNGFSLETEKPHQEQVRRYIDECKGLYQTWGRSHDGQWYSLLLPEVGVPLSEQTIQPLVEYGAANLQ